MKKSIFAVVLVIVAANLASAENVRGINIDFAKIGNAGNAADWSGQGAVGYDYNIGKYTITNAQWNSFTGAAGAPAGSDGAVDNGQFYSAYGQGSYWTGDQKPVNTVSWYEAAQFCNYLTSGDKSKGAYQFSGDNSYPGAFQGVNRTAAQAAYGKIYVLPTEDEWYKAAYYKPDASGYSLYSNGTDTAPSGTESNYNSGQPWNVGMGQIEQNGTYDMLGNVWQWNETLLYNYYRVGHGGAYDSGVDSLNNRLYLSPPPFSSHDVGFRVVAIPEPATIGMMILGGMMIRAKRKN